MRFVTAALVGWILFLGSSVGFIVSSYNSGDMAAMTGSVLFFLGCVAFLVPTRTQT